MEQLSLLDEYTNKKIDDKLPIVLSASRMTDMPKYYPNELINAVETRIRKGVEIHTLVLWSKHPNALLTNPLFNFLEKLIDMNIQIYFQCTITGMGKKTVGYKRDGKSLILEHNSPEPEHALEDLALVIKLLGSPLRVRLRIDPLIRIKSCFDNKEYSNLNCVKPIIAKACSFGISNFSISFLEKGMHKKVDKRFNELGWNIVPPSLDERIKASNWLNHLAEIYHVNIYACSVPGLPESRCIDGYLLQSLHPSKRLLRLDEPRKRQLCACTHSIDIGGWPPKKCFTGCLYCYANAIHM